MATDKEITGQWNLSYVRKKLHFLLGMGNWGFRECLGRGGTAVSYGKGWVHSYSGLTVFFFSILEVFS